MRTENVIHNKETPYSYEEKEAAIFRETCDNTNKESNQEVKIKWAVAVTSAPRKDCTLLQCLEYLEDCGWDPIVFAEPGTTPTSCLTVHNPIRLGVWHNWLNSARWCLSNTDAEAILTVQDDCSFHPDSKEFVESLMWPPDCGFISLYTPKHYTIKKDGTYRPTGVNRVVTRSLWGACALVWPRAVLEQVVKHKQTTCWYGAGPKKSRKENKTRWEIRRNAWYKNKKDNPHTIANSDTAIGKIVNRLNKKMYFIDPSPVEHIALYSSINHGDNKGRRNAFRIADHSLPLGTQL